MYGRLGAGRAPWWRIYSPGTLRIYARAVLARQRLRPPAEDTRQLGADAVVVDGVVRVLWLPRSPDDRPSAADVVAAAQQLLAP